MKKIVLFLISASIFLIAFTINIQTDEVKQLKKETQENFNQQRIITGAEQPEQYLSLLNEKNIALVVNQTSLNGKIHLVDFLLQNNIKIKKIFAPEHGFRGNYEAGEHFENQIDSATKIPVITLFGKNLRPNSEQLKNVDLIIFDIQDVGVRFYTYISTMHEIMEACATFSKKLIILDRPNPNGDYVDGPVLKSNEFKSFVGMHQIALVHGLTVGELAQMINGEKWLTNGKQCDLTIIKVKNYTHKSRYSIPVKPSPNLINDLSIRLYPSLCFFEATNFSIGRGTQIPFLIIGYPDKKFGNFSFIPKDIKGMQVNPLHKNTECFGDDLRNESIVSKFTLKYILKFYKLHGSKPDFFKNPRWFNLLAGNSTLQQQIKSGLTEEEIKKSWQSELSEYKKIRKKYLLYDDFE